MILTFLWSHFQFLTYTEMSSVAAVQNQSKKVKCIYELNYPNGIPLLCRGSLAGTIGAHTQREKSLRHLVC